MKVRETSTMVSLALQELKFMEVKFYKSEKKSNNYCL